MSKSQNYRINSLPHPSSSATAVPFPRKRNYSSTAVHALSSFSSSSSSLHCSPSSSASSSSSSSSSSSRSSSSRSSSSIRSLGNEAEFHKTTQILHQLCALEQIYQEFFAELDNLKKAAVRATSKLYYVRKYLFVNPDTGKMARRDDNVLTLQTIIKTITQSQRELVDNLIPEYWLEKLESNFLSALSNKQLHLRSIPEWNNQVGLFSKTKSLIPSPPPVVTDNLTINSKKRKRARPKGCSIIPNKEISIKGIEFILFSFPNIFDEDDNYIDPTDLGFNGELMFDETNNDENYVCLGLGMARVINHNCSENVVWKFPENKMEFDTKINGVGCSIGRLYKTKGFKRLVNGGQIYAFYSRQFAKNECHCQSRRYHKPPNKSKPTTISPSLTPPNSSSSRTTSSNIRTPNTSITPVIPVTVISHSRISSRKQATSTLDTITSIIPETLLSKHNYIDPDDDPDEDHRENTSSKTVELPKSSFANFKRPRVILSPETDTEREIQFDQLVNLPFITTEDDLSVSSPADSLRSIDLDEDPFEDDNISPGVEHGPMGTTSSGEIEDDDQVRKNKVTIGYGLEVEIEPGVVLLEDEDLDSGHEDEFDDGDKINHKDAIDSANGYEMDEEINNDSEVDDDEEIVFIKIVKNITPTWQTSESTQKCPKQIGRREPEPGNLPQTSTTTREFSPLFNIPFHIDPDNIEKAKKDTEEFERLSEELEVGLERVKKAVKGFEEDREVFRRRDLRWKNHIKFRR